MKSLWQEVLDLTRGGPPGTQGFMFRLGTGEVFHSCLICQATFPQSGEGWKALKQHGFEEHEQPTLCDWRELDGKQATIAVVERVRTAGFGEHKRPYGGNRIELLARTDDGTIYFLPNPTDGFGGSREGWKWKPKPDNNLLKLMPPEVVSPSNG